MADAPSFVAADPPAAAAVAPTNGATTSPAEEGIKVFAGNLAYGTDDDALKAFFSASASDVLSAQVIHRGTRSAGYGFVSFKTFEAAQTAVTALNQKELDGRAVIVEIAKAPEEKVKRPKQPKKRAPRKSADDNAEQPAAEGTAAPAAGEGEGGEKPKKKKKKPARKPKAEGADADAVNGSGENAAAAVKKTTPRAPRPKRPAGEDPVGEPSKTMVFVANLGFNVDDAQLAELFTTAGLNVTSAHVVKRRWGKPRKSKGYGFVDVGTEEEQQKAIETLQNKEIDGRQIAVKIAVNATHDESDARPSEEAAAAAEA